MAGKAKQLDYQQIAAAMNTMLHESRGKEISKDELVRIIGDCIPIKSKSSKILGEMIKDNCVKKVRSGKQFHYTLMDYPILWSRIQKWVEAVRAYNKGCQVRNHVNKDAVIEFLERASTEELVSIMKPACEKHNLKLYVPNGYDKNLIAQLPKEILDRITLYKEV